jgi:8-oxo-dGTP pyrophosphatase MutT (NUDIX family)
MEHNIATFVASLDELVSRFPASELRLTRPDAGSGLRAAVAVVLREGAGGTEILFIKRAERAGDPWSGHMAFPGGRREAEDPSLLHTSTRETLEEVGLDLAAHARPVARLPDVMPYSRMEHPLTVSAFVFALERPATLALSDEVAEIIWTPLDPVLRGDTATRFRWRRDGLDLDLPALDVQGHIVWGLTYRMLELLREPLDLTPR